ncbi:MAG TPA: hypothetical protein DF613_13830, partial [Lachnospiraceae bacterium]|nr:hypothetical protein [Lachnospiraceae bacterium]
IFVKINAYIIKDFMESVELRSKLISDRLECKISRPGIYTECIKIRTNTIYVADPNELAGNNNMVKGGCFLLTSCPDYALLQAEADFLYPSSPVDRVTLLDLVLEVFEKFNTWEVALHDCLNSVTPLQDVGDCSLLFLRNPAGIYTNSFRILCYYETPRPRQLALYHEEDVDAFLSDDDINELLMHPDFADSWMSEGPERFCSLDQMVKVLYINIQINGKNLYRIVVNEYDNPFRDSDYTILNI